MAPILLPLPSAAAPPRARDGAHRCQERPCPALAHKPWGASPSPRRASPSVRRASPSPRLAVLAGLQLVCRAAATEGVPRARALRVAALYSGRFYGNQTPAWYANHLQHLIRPHNVSVFVVSDVENWCHAPAEARAAIHERRMHDADAIFQREVRAAFGEWPYVYARLISHASCKYHDKILSEKTLEQMFRNAARAVNLTMSAHYWRWLLRRWYWQFFHYASAEALREEHAPHDIVMRLRMDILFNVTAPMAKLEQMVADGSTVLGRAYYGKFAYSPEPHGLMLDLMASHCDSEGKSLTSHAASELKRRGVNDTAHAHIPCQRLYMDQLFVGTPRSMRPLSEQVEVVYNLSKTSRTLLFDNTTRCFGLCPEEQSVLHLRHMGVTLRPIPWTFSIVRYTSRRATPAHPRSRVCAIHA
ncbi:hypothetical protein AB1Y20_021109 [Prymnesium parvum]|uniref:Protein xylosyltransferase n=1 Tax=Prymnesium parvum TaxID=97485 RepID=A0AB34JHE3_PRYPA